MIKAFLFDIGKVLLNFDYQQAVDHVRAKSSLSGEQIRAAIGQFHAPLETGAISTGTFLEQAIEATSYSGSPEEFAAGYCDIFTPNQPMWELVDALQANYPLYLFSNTSDLHWDFIRAKFPQFESFSDGVFSMRVKAMKPDPAIYDAALELTKVEAGEIFYIDDLAANIDAARVLGFHTHLYIPGAHEALIAALAKAGLRENAR